MIIKDILLYQVFIVIFNFKKGITMSKYKTIKQTADELGVSKDKVKYRVGKLPDNYIVKKDGVIYLTNEAIQAISEDMG